MRRHSTLCPAYCPGNALPSHNFRVCLVPQVETIGSLFIVAGGLLREEEDGAVAVRDRWDPLHAEKVRGGGDEGFNIMPGPSWCQPTLLAAPCTPPLPAQWRPRLSLV